MVDEAELKAQMVEAFEGASYPLESPMALLPALPNGPRTRFESGDFSMSVVELHVRLSSEFPYESAEAMADHILEELHEKDIL